MNYKDYKPLICRGCPTWDDCQGSNQEDCEHRLSQAADEGAERALSEIRADLEQG